MLEGRLYRSPRTGGIYECTSVGAELALMRLVAGGYEGKDPNREAVFLDELQDLEWSLVNDDEIDAEVERAKKVIDHDYEMIDYYRWNIEEMRKTNDYLLSKKESNG